MKTTILWTLVAINVLLFASFIGRYAHSGTALAQPAAQRQQPMRGDYIMIPAEVVGAAAGIVYIIDTSNARLSAMSWDQGPQRLVSMQSIDLVPIFQRGAAPDQPRPGR